MLFNTCPTCPAQPPLLWFCCAVLSGPELSTLLPSLLECLNTGTADLWQHSQLYTLLRSLTNLCGTPVSPPVPHSSPVRTMKCLEAAVSCSSLHPRLRQCPEYCRNVRGRLTRLSLLTGWLFHNLLRAH